MSIGIYDLSKYPTTYDFAGWCVYAKTSGATHVHFIADKPIASWKYGGDEVTAWRRFGTILAPMTRLAGLTFSVGPRMLGKEYPYLAGQIEELYKRIGQISLLKPTFRLEKKDYVTITIRESFRTRYRNSNIEAWTKFKEYLKARKKDIVWLGEAEGQPLDLEYRMALYAGADMNLGACNGPMALCCFSDAPHITMNMNPPKPADDDGYDILNLWMKQRFPPGSQLSFRNERQKMVWETDTYENIVKAYEEMCG